MEKVLKFPQMFDQYNLYDKPDIQKILQYDIDLLEVIVANSQMISKTKYQGRKDKVNGVVDIFFSTLEKRIEDFDKDFEDVHERVFNCTSIVYNLEQIIHSLDEDKVEEKYVLRMAIIVHDLIKKINVVDLTREHVDIIKDAVLRMISVRVNKTDIIEIDNALIHSCADWIFGG